MSTQYGVEGADNYGGWCHYGDAEGLTQQEAVAYAKKFGGYVVGREVTEWERA